VPSSHPSFWVVSQYHSPSSPLPLSLALPGPAFSRELAAPPRVEARDCGALGSGWGLVRPCRTCRPRCRPFHGVTPAVTRSWAQSAVTCSLPLPSHKLRWGRMRGWRRLRRASKINRKALKNPSYPFACGNDQLSQDVPSRKLRRGCTSSGGRTCASSLCQSLEGVRRLRSSYLRTRSARATTLRRGNAPRRPING